MRLVSQPACYNSPMAVDPECRLCSLRSQPEYFLLQTDLFTVVGDPHPVTAGHILIVPLEHTESVGTYTPEQLRELKKLHAIFREFLRTYYGTVATFEHGKLGQTISHSHVHLLPFNGPPEAIIPEGMDRCEVISSFDELTQHREKDGGYLYFAIGNQAWVVDAQLATPRFFRDRFATALGQAERGDWQQLKTNPIAMHTFEYENKRLLENWRSIQ